MNRSSNRERRHKPRISEHTLESNDLRREDSKECTDASSDDDDDDDEEEDEQDRSSDQESDLTEDSVGNRRQWAALAKYLKSHRAYLEHNKPENFSKAYGGKKEKKEKKDKTTQKNLASPMPSIWKPPIFKEVTGAPGFRVLKSKQLNGKESGLEDAMLRYIKKLQTNKSDPDKPCSHRLQQLEKNKKLCPKHKAQADQKPKKGRRESVHTCLDLTIPNIHSNIPQTEDINIHSQCGLPIRYYQERQEPLNRKLERKGSGKVREKLVYVVEEEGNDVAKMETDLFSLNEILTIKKDLLELSEFAKKLKKLKEMRKESDKEKSCGSECQCKPVAELLKDVNKRMEALEARQEDLERGIQKGRETETETKKTDDTKTSSISPPKGAIKPHPSAVKSVPSFEKTEVTNASADGGGAFSKNLEIVNELLDIKSQLQKLERKRLSKEFTPENGQSGSRVSKTKGKEQGINVFSSKTYILTADAFNKKRNAKETSTDEKYSNIIPVVEKSTPVNLERRPVKETVVDWLRNIQTSSPIPDSSVNAFVTSRNIQNEVTPEESWEMRSSVKDKNRSGIIDRKDFENQEPQKNRAKDTGRLEQSLTAQKLTRDLSSYLEVKDYHHLGASQDKPNGRMHKYNDTDIYPTKLSPMPHFHRKTNVPVRQTASSSSVPTAIVVKEEVQRTRNTQPDLFHSHGIQPSRSKSAHEFPSNLSKTDKMIFNMSRRKLGDKGVPKKEKNESERFQGKCDSLIKFMKRMSPNRSRLVASVNLEEANASFNRTERSNHKEQQQLPMFPFPILPSEIYRIIECCDEEKDSRKEKCSWIPQKKSTDCHHKKDKFQNCINKCYKKKKTKVKCSRNVCCNKKARKNASCTSRCCPHKHRRSAKNKKCTCDSKTGKQCSVHKAKCPKICSGVIPLSPEPSIRKEQKKCKVDKKHPLPEGTFLDTRSSSDETCRKKKHHCTNKKHRSKKPCPKKSCTHRKSCDCKRHMQKKLSPVSKTTTLCDTTESEKETVTKKESSASTPTTSVSPTSNDTPSSEVCATTDASQSSKPISTTPKCTQTSDEPSVVYSKVKKPTRKSPGKQPECHDSPCYITSIWKSFRKIYPRFSNLQLISWLKFYCQQAESQKEAKSNRGAMQYKSFREKDRSYHCPDCQRKVSHVCSKQSCKSYRMSTLNQKWPGVGPSSELSEDSATEEETRSSSSSTETDFMFPYRKSDLYNVYQATTEEEEKQEPIRKKKKKEKKRSGSDESDLEERLCECVKCGNLHSKKQIIVNYGEFSGNTNSKVKSGDKPKKSFLAMLGEVRHLRVSDGKRQQKNSSRFKFKRKKKTETDCGCMSGAPICTCGPPTPTQEEEADLEEAQISRSDDKSCHCRPKLEELEDRINILESFKRLLKQKEPVSCECKKGKKKRRKKKKKKDSTNESDPDSDDSKKKKKKKKKEKKKKKKKKKKKSESNDCDPDTQEETLEKDEISESNNESEPDCDSELSKKKKKKKKKKKRRKRSSDSDQDSEETGKKKKKKKGKKKGKKKKDEEYNESEAESENERYERKQKRKKKKCDCNIICKIGDERKEEIRCKCTCMEEEKVEDESDPWVDGNEEISKEQESSDEEIPKKTTGRYPEESYPGEPGRKKTALKMVRPKECKCVPPKDKPKCKKKTRLVPSEYCARTYYCDVNNKNFKKDQKHSEQTSPTTTTTSRSSEKLSFKQKVDSSLEALRKKKKEMLEKLSSFSLLWRVIRDKRKYDGGLVDDPSRSSEIPKKKSLRPMEDEFVYGKKQKRRRKSKSRTRRHRS